LRSFGFTAGRVILFLLLIGLLIYRTKGNLTFQIRDIIRRDGDQLPTVFSSIAQEIEMILSAAMHDHVSYVRNFCCQ
jgi:hypothetical protein